MDIFATIIAPAVPDSDIGDIDDIVLVDEDHPFHFGTGCTIAVRNHSCLFTMNGSSLTRHPRRTVTTPPQSISTTYHGASPLCLFMDTDPSDTFPCLSIDDSSVTQTSPSFEPSPYYLCKSPSSSLLYQPANTSMTF